MRLFISYAHDDIRKVRQLVAIFRQGGHEPWFDEKLHTGEEWRDKLREEIEAADALVYVITPASIESEWCRWELATAIRAAKRIIPILLRKVDAIPSPLNKYQYIDLTKGIRATETARLLGDIAVLIPREEAPSAPDKPAGKPSRAEVSGRLGVMLAVLGLVATFLTVAATYIGLLPQATRDHYLYMLGMAPASPTPTLTATLTYTPTATFTPTPTPTPTRTPFPTATPIEGPIADLDDVAVVVARFNGDDQNALQQNIREEIEIAASRLQNNSGTGNTHKAHEVYVIPIGHALNPDVRAEIARVSDTYRATLVIYGRKAEDVVTTRYAITPRVDTSDIPSLATLSILRVPKGEVNNFETVVVRGAGSSYVVWFTTGQVYYLAKSLQDSLQAFSNALNDSLLTNGSSSCKVGQSSKLSGDLRVDALYVSRGNTYSELQRYNDAINDYSCAIQLNPVNALAFYNRANAYYFAGNLAHAVEDYHAALALQSAADDPLSRVETLINLAGTLAEQGLYADAVETYQEAQDILEQFVAADAAQEKRRLADSSRLNNNIGRLYFDWGSLCLANSPAADSAVCEAVQPYGDAESLNNQVEAYYQDALADQRAIKHWVGQAVTLNNLAQFYESAGQDDQAEASYKEALALFTPDKLSDPDSESRLLTNLGQFFCTLTYSGRSPTLRDFDQAVQSFERAAEIQADVSADEARGMTLFALGACYNKAGDSESAVESLTEAIELLGGNSDLVTQAYGERANAYILSGDVDSAMPDVWAWVQGARTPAATAGTLQIGETITLEMHTDDAFYLPFRAEANQVVDVLVCSEAPSRTETIDPLLILLNPAQQPLLFSDDEIGLDPQISAAPLDAEGEYTLVLTHGILGGEGTVVISLRMSGDDVAAWDCPLD